ncbi:MAG: tRNA-(ms[2]io[6]A)-hydroxylase [Bacteroidetes bacterium]|nr:tRNA-(ms[2]io[6]A)-hydroxylase [Bacteroidota bacterium]PHX83174.1 MAG: tRNA 2-methylthio-N6-isopentenyl adenosine(37) hydroxylase MiaE [Flavobacteriales bacterium]
MLGLKLSTDPRWVNIVESNIDEILTDHAYCEQKAASNAISIIVNHPEYPELVSKMVDIAREELEHFQMVHQLIIDRGQVLGRERKDNYVNELMKFIKIPFRLRVEVLVDRLLLAAMIEARSCERFRVLSENIKDVKLAKFYRDLMISEADHYTTFITFARELGIGVDVEKRWQEFLDYEATVISSYGSEEKIHG